MHTLIITLITIMALALGIAIGHIRSSRATQREATARITAEAKCQALSEQQAQQEQQHQQQLQQLKDQAQAQQTQLLAQQQAQQTQLQQQYQAQLQAQQHLQQQQLQQLQAQHQRQQEQLQAQHQSQQEQLQAQHQQILTQTKDSIKAEFAAMAEDSMKRREAELKAANAEQLKPFQTELSRLQEALLNAQRADSARHGAMDKTIEGLLSQTQALSQNASSLAQALRSNGKMQGDWGEQLLESILEESGLRKEHEFYTQASFTTKTGQQLRPDVVVNCPDDRRIIIDSKVSLTAWLDYCQAQTREQVEAATKANLRSVTQHIDELADKNYASVVPGALQQVLMFVPNEGSYILALQADPQLGQTAYRKGIILVNPTNLMLALQMIYNLWQTERQNKNTEEVVRQAAALYDKFATFVESFDDVRKKITALQDTADKAYNQLSDGRGNIVGRIEKLRTLGINPKKTLPNLFDTNPSQS